MILVVDDNRDNALMLVRLLRRFDCNVQAVFSGPELFERLRGQAVPALLILDVRMLEMDGWQCLATLRAEPRWKDIPVLMYTADSCPHGRAEAKRLGAQDYIVKGSILWPDLLFRIQQFLPSMGCVDQTAPPPATSHLH